MPTRLATAAKDLVDATRAAHVALGELIAAARDDLVDPEQPVVHKPARCLCVGDLVEWSGRQLEVTAVRSGDGCIVAELRGLPGGMTELAYVPDEALVVREPR